MNKIISILFTCLLHTALAVASTYNLRVEVTPNGAATLNTTGGTYEQETSISLRTYKNTGYTFIGWFDGETLLSTSTSFNYKMPARDAVVQARYEFDPSVPDNPAMPDTTTYYLFTADVSPIGAGTLNTNSGKYAAGTNVNMYIYLNTGYQFIGWQNENGEILSTSTSYKYKMPQRNAHLTAICSYDPTVPANPDSMGINRTIAVECRPVGGGTFNTTKTTATAGSSVRLYAYTNTGFKFLHWENEEGDLLSTESSFYYNVPDKDSKVYGIFDYDPDVPSNPNKNYWDKELGELIIDDFEIGKLNSAASQAIDGSSYSDVTMIIVSGRMNDNDFGISNNYSNCTLLDLSRVTGVSEVPSYAFDGSNLESVYLPNTIESIGYRAFYNCSQLTSVTCYAMTPPTLENQVFRGIPEGLIVYVPATVVSQYQEADVWKDFTILPIQEDMRSLTVNLPEGTDIANYKQMWLELINVKNGQRLHYIMTDRLQYIFPNLIRNTTWNAQVRNEGGDIFGRIDNIEVKDEDVTATFTSLKQPQTVTLKVVTPDNNDITSQVQVIWTDSDGKYVSQQPFINGLIEGKQLNYQISLQRSAAMLYNTPELTSYIIKGDNNNIVCKLTDIPLVTIEGKVVDASNGQTLNGAIVSASQTFAGMYTKVENVKTNTKGIYKLQLPNTNTVISVSANDYISQSLVCDTLIAGKEEVTLPVTRLKSISGAVLNISFTYTNSVVSGAKAETFNGYQDYNNVSYTIYNKTKNKAISQFNVQYPNIVLLEEVSEGDQLQVTATSLNSAFVPVECTSTITNQEADFIFNILELGKIDVKFKKTINSKVSAILYDTNGKFIKSYDYNKAALTISNLVDGKYTLVSMGSSQILNTIYELDKFAESGLVLGKDYAQESVAVKSGVISNITFEEIPLLDESKFYYTGNGTSFSVNKTSIVSGNYLTLTGKVNFKQEYANQVGNVNLIVDLPAECSFVENSVMVGNSTSSYTIDGNRITIPMAQYTDRVRFCVIPTRGGNYAPSAFVSFDLNGKNICQPIGSANYTAKDLSISIPKMIAKTTLPVTGTAIGRSTVEIFDNGVKIGETTSLANGAWSTTCELCDPYNLSTHRIYAKVKTKQGLELQSEIKECLYDKNAIEVKTVTMSFYNGWLRKTINVLFDYNNPQSAENSYMFYSTTDFTFVVDFTNNSPDIVSYVTIMVYTDNNKIIPVEAEYNKKLDRWVAVREFSWGNLPVNVSVDYIAKSKMELDPKDMNHINDDIEKIIDDIDTELKEETEIIEELKTELKKDNYSETKINYLINIILKYDDDSDVKLTPEQEEFINNTPDNIQNIPYNKVDEALEKSINDIGKPFNKPMTIEPQDIGNGIKTPKIEIVPNENNNQCLLDNSWNIPDDFDYSDNKISLVNDNGDKMTVDFSNSNVPNDNQSYIDFDNYNNKVLSYINDYFGPFNDIVGGAELLYKGDLLLNKKMLLNLQKEGIGKGNIDKWMKLLDDRAHIKGRLAQFEKANKILGPIGLGLSVWDLGESGRGIWKDNEKWDSLRDAILEACTPEAANELNQKLDEYRKWLQNRNWRRTALKGVSTGLNAVGVFAAPETLGGSLLLFAAGMGLSSLTDFYEKKYQQTNNQNWKSLLDDVKKKGDECKPLPIPTETPISPFEPITPIHDPSGYVYEAVSSNRIQGVTATVYYKEMVEDMYGDLHENIVKWDAEEYAQKNPLFTDENGMYRWDVPQGMWQVKYEKEGYETTYSEWLPVPPPQLEVNIGIKQNVQPNVESARAFENAIEVKFDKYMLPELLNSENIIVTANGNIVDGSIELLDEEISYEGRTEKYASKLRFNATEPFPAKEVTLLVKNRVKSYADVRMQDDYSQSFTVELEVRKIDCDSIVTVIYGEESSITINVLPAAAAAGKTLNVTALSTMMLTVDATSVILDENGSAEITISGELPGTTALEFDIDGYDISATTTVSILTAESLTVATPTASIVSGAEVEKGTKLYLSCETKGAIILYTLDGSCPCDDSDAVMVYDGTPIAINENTIIKAMAIAYNMYESEVVEFSYYVNATGIDDTTMNGHIHIYPLPVRERVNISAGGKTIKNVTVTALSGTTVASSNQTSKMVTLDVSSVATGMYIINIQTEDGIYSRKVMKVQ